MKVSDLPRLQLVAIPSQVQQYGIKHGHWILVKDGKVFQDLGRQVVVVSLCHRYRGMAWGDAFTIWYDKDHPGCVEARRNRVEYRFAEGAQILIWLPAYKTFAHTFLNPSVIAEFMKAGSIKLPTARKFYPQVWLSRKRCDRLHSPTLGKTYKRQYHIPTDNELIIDFTNPPPVILPPLVKVNGNLIARSLLTLVHEFKRLRVSLLDAGYSVDEVRKAFIAVDKTVLDLLE